MFLRIEQRRFDHKPFIVSGSLGHVIYVECNNYMHGRSRAQGIILEETTNRPEIYEDKYFTVHTPLVHKSQFDMSSGVVTTFYLDYTITIDEVTTLNNEMLSTLKERVSNESNRST